MNSFVNFWIESSLLVRIDFDVVPEQLEGKVTIDNLPGAVL